VPDPFLWFLPLTLFQLLSDAQHCMREKGIESARLDSELLLCHCLGLDRVDIYRDADQQVPERKVQAFFEIIRRRAAYEPVAYITGRRDFWTLSIAVQPGVLIPRPETEVLVERALSFLIKCDAARPRVLDIGTGSGAIALALAAEMPRLEVVALDASDRAAECARANADRLGLADRVCVEQGSFPDACSHDENSYDLIVSNPPYIATADIANLAPDIRDFEPHEALDGGADGRAVYRAWIPHCAALLNDGGVLMLEIGHDQAAAVTGLLADAGCYDGSKVVQDYAGHDRVVIAIRR
jgi:release factor glutamine methyltransferase